MIGKLHRILAGSDAPGRGALPAGEFFHPATLVATATLVLNDQLLKRSGWAPSWLTGKLSDIAAFIFFPLLCTALVDVALLALSAVGLRVDFSLRRWKLAVAIAFTAALMAAIKLSPAAADAVASWLGRLGFRSAIVADPLDLLAMPALAIAYAIGRTEIARVPLGRLAVIRRAGPPAARNLRDVRRLATDADAVDQLAGALDGWMSGGDVEPANRALHRLR